MRQFIDCTNVRTISHLSESDRCEMCPNVCTKDDREATSRQPSDRQLETPPCKILEIGRAATESGCSAPINIINR